MEVQHSSLVAALMTILVLGLLCLNYEFSHSSSVRRFSDSFDAVCNGDVLLIHETICSTSLFLFLLLTSIALFSLLSPYHHT
jgi:hypothetical protein